MSDDDQLSLDEAAKFVGVTPATLKRWVDDGVIPDYRGSWTKAAAAHGRIVKQLRDRGHSLESIKREGERGTLAFAYLEEVYPSPDARFTPAQAAEQMGVNEEMLWRIIRSVGLNPTDFTALDEEDIELFGKLGQLLSVGLPLDVFLQMVRVYGQALAQIAEAEVRLIHLYVHEPMIKAGVEGSQISEGLEFITKTALSNSKDILDYLHRRFLRQFIEENIIYFMESRTADLEQGRLPVAIAFADLAGYTRLTEEEGEESALDAIERFMTAIENTLPDGARVLKTIGDEAMIVGTDPKLITQWAVDFQAQQHERPLPRIGIHYGDVTYREGDYFGREVNQAARVAARAAGGEVLVTRPVVELAKSDGLAFELIGEVSLKGFSEPTELFLARDGS